MSPDDESLGWAFAEHLRARDSNQASRLAEALRGYGDSRRADLLLAFADRGEHTLRAPWWLPEATCHIGLHLPDKPARGDVWFDPLEASVFLGLPWAAPPPQPGVSYAERPLPNWYGWLAIGPVPTWQVAGAAEVRHGLPATPDSATAEGGGRFGDLVGKAMAMAVDWNVLRRGYGDEMVRRVWGAHEVEFGLGGPRSGDFVLLTRRQLLEWDPDSPGTPDDVFGRAVLGHRFRTFASTQIGLLTTEDGALERRWTF